MADEKRKQTQKPVDPNRKNLREKKRLHRDLERSRPSGTPRRNTRSEVDDSAPGPRQGESERGPVETPHSEANPGGTSGEHSGQRQPD
jgi:hypothetical protein